MMKTSLLMMLILSFTKSALGDTCCKAKVVGGSTYKLKGEEDTSSFSCEDKCTYSKEGEPNSKYCFAEGNLKVECKESVSAAPAQTTGGGGVTGGGGSTVGRTTVGATGGGVTTGGGNVGASTVGSGCKCGVKKTSRIVGGTETEVNEYPWMSAISDADENQFCGGTLIGSQWVLSASHCFFDQMGNNPTQASTVRIVLGEHDLTTQDESKIPKKVVKVSKIITHPSYNSDTSDNDIALLKLSEEVDLNVYTPACVAKTGETFDGKNAWVYGWGTTASGGQSSDKLLEVEIPVVTNAVCQTALSGQGATITDAMLCAGGQKNKDGCQGDSGGPLTVDVSGQHVLIGDVSYGIGCGQDGLYGVYGNVAYLRSWVDTTVAANGGANYCPA